MPRLQDETMNMKYNVAMYTTDNDMLGSQCQQTIGSGQSGAKGNVNTQVWNTVVQNTLKERTLNCEKKDYLVYEVTIIWISLMIVL